MADFIDSRFKPDDYDRMRKAVATSQSRPGPAPVSMMPAARPTSAATGLPMGVEEMAKRNMRPGTGLAPGVEQRAKEQRLSMVGPVQPTVINGMMPVPKETPFARGLPSPSGDPGMVGGPAMRAPAPDVVASPLMMAPAARAPMPMMPPPAAPGIMMPPSPSSSYSNPVSGSALGMGSRPLGGGARPSGRSSMDPQRIAEQEARKGNLDLLIRMRMNEQNQGFQREMFDRGQAAEAGRDQRNFDQGLTMFGMQQQSEQARDAREWEQSNQLFERDTQRRANESEADFQRRQQAEIEQEKRNSIVGYENMPTPDGKGYVPVGITQGGSMRPAGGYMPNQQDEGFQMMPIPGTQDSVITQGGRPVPGLPMFTQEPAPPGGGPTRPVPKPEPQKDPVFKQDSMTGRMFWMQPDGQGGFVRRWVKDEDGDGVPDVPAGGGGGGTPQAPAQTSTGVKFKIK